MPLPPLNEYENAVRSMATRLLVDAGEEPVPSDISLAGSHAAGVAISSAALDLVGRVRQDRALTDPAFRRAPFDRQEARVAEYLDRMGGAGTGTDPVGLLIASHQRAHHVLDANRDRVAELETAVSNLRHDVRGLLSPAMLMADTLREHADSMVASAVARIILSLDKTVERLQQTYEVVPAVRSNAQPR